VAALGLEVVTAMEGSQRVRAIAARLWALLGGDPAALSRLRPPGPRRVLPSAFDVTGLAPAAVGAATLAVAELDAVRTGRDLAGVSVTTREACAAVRCETLFAPQGWALPPGWDPVAGDYEGSDGWIRLHTNYAHHRAAALRTLGVSSPDRAAVARAVAAWRVDELEAQIVAEGGAAAAMRPRARWLAHPQGVATVSTPPVQLLPRAHWPAPTPPHPAGPTVDVPGRSSGTPDQPLEGIRVLDLTRVIAGPVATRFLAAWGARVLRIDPPGFAEVPALVPETTAGKRCAALDLTSPPDRARMLDLVRDADVVVAGLRPGALTRLGLDGEVLRAVNPALIVAELDAYGSAGPWAGRRGFDSLVQMSCGLAAAQGIDRPRPLPVQALDHGTGMLLAAAVCRALTLRATTGQPADIRGALIGTANLLWELPDPGPDPDAPAAPPPAPAAVTEPRSTWWGPARAVPIPGRVGDLRPRLPIEPGPLGRHAPEFPT